ncbi:MAG: MMPL family transporter [Planctomycetota bacterium]
MGVVQAKTHGIDRLAARIARAPALGGLLLGALTVMAALGLTLSAPIGRYDEGPAWDRAEETNAQFDLDDVLAIVAVNGPVLDATDGPRHAETVRALERAMEALPWQLDLVTPWDVPGLAAAPLARAAEHPLVRDTLVDQAGRGLLLPLRWQDKDTRSTLAGNPFDAAQGAIDEALSRQAASLLRTPAATKLDIGLTGRWPIARAQARAFSSERWRFQLLGALLGFVIASLAFRDVRATLLAGLPPVLGVGLAIGMTRLFGFGATGFTSIVLPLLVLTIGFTDSLHIVVQAARCKRAAPESSGGEATARALAELAWPCSLTSLTTAIGFASLAVTGSPIVREFGLSCALATLITFLCVMLTTPLLARTPLGSALERVRPPRFDADPNVAGSGLTRWIAAGLDATLRRPRLCAAGALVATCALIGLAGTLQIDRRTATDLAGSSPAARTLARVDKELGGAFPIQVRLDWDASTSGAAVLAVARDARLALRAEPMVTVSIGPDSFAEGVDARDPFAWAALAALPKQWTAPVIDLDARRALLHARIPDAGSAALAPVFERLRVALASAERQGVRATLVGAQIAYLETVTRVARDLAQSLVLAAALILVTLAIAFRSWRLGLASVVPNLLPLAASAGGLALVGGNVDISTLTALTLSLGIATDDTIHVLARWRRARATGQAPRAAARDAVLRTLPALALTTLTLTAAFAQLLTSDLETIRQFGLLAATTLAAAFVADVWVLPAFLVVLARPAVHPAMPPAMPPSVPPATCA